MTTTPPPVTVPTYVCQCGELADLYIRPAAGEPRDVQYWSISFAACYRHAEPAIRNVAERARTNKLTVHIVTTINTEVVAS